MDRSDIIVIIFMASGSIAGFFIGRESVPPEIKTIEVIRTVEVEVEKHRETNETVVKHPDGSETTTRRTTEDTSKHKTDKKEESTQTVSTSRPYHVSALAGVSVQDLKSPVYGIHVSKDFIGPVNLGAWGLTDGSVGVSIGVSF